MSGLQRAGLLALLALSLAGAALLYLSRGDAGAARSAERPDLAIDQPHWRIFNQQGRLTRELRATRLEKWPDDSSARLLAPRLQLSDRRAQRWLALARVGWLDQNRQLRLEQDVRLQRQPPAAALLLRTERLRLDETAAVVDTDQPVVLTAGNWHFTAIGLRAELDQPQLQLQLLENVRGTHD